MSAELLQLLNGVQTMSIVGMCKNAGKTTMLNWMLHHDRLQGTLGLTSIGRDGESTDAVSYTHLDVYKRQVFPQGANAVLHRNRKVNIIYIM